MPETYIATLDDEEGTEYVVGLQAIPQERWELVSEEYIIYQNAYYMNAFNIDSDVNNYRSIDVRGL